MRIKKFVLALAVGATATTAWADSPYGYGGAGPALPLPEISSTWNTGVPSPGVVSTSYNSPTGSSWDQSNPARFDRAARPEPTEPERSAAGIDRARAGLSRRGRRRVALGMRLRW